ncbi:MULTISPECIES: helix-turn-helix domain-containing protein [Streptomyces]|uniref:helix-turn-helix domain-containing protein n=1 Tax=Streptomyces TaxID=1883 RepID=UPI001CA67B62|nr:helix-turn-helix transcriptional regulator [Streptomyces sennicomposti]MBY8865982.1 helix-turn-helix domain-containing protein [Streptomyces sennicomposti]
MNHSTWRTRRTRQLAGEAVEYDQEYVDARLAGDLGQAVYNRRIELGLSQTELAERAGMTQPQVSRMEGGDTVPTLPLLRRLAKALQGTLNLTIDEGDSHVTFTPHAA